jgi:toxin ParE1/3/4
MLPLRWTEQAVEHLGGIADFISLSSPLYAEGMILRIELRLQLPRTHPQIGKPALEFGDQTIRELVEHPYRIFYRPLPDCIEVLAIVHGRNEIPDMPLRQE